MGFLRIRPPQARALQAIAEKPPEEFAELVNALCDQDSPSIKATDLQELVSRLSGDDEFSFALCNQVISLATFRRVRKMDPEELVDGLFEGMRDAEFPESAIDWYEKVRADFLRLLNCDSVRLPAKALHLSTDHEKLLESANVVTDVRPVFDGERSSIVGAVVIQTLRAHYFAAPGDRGRQEISLALDSDDIEKLIQELEQARRKAQVAKEALSEKLERGIFVFGEETYGFG